MNKDRALASMLSQISNGCEKAMASLHRELRPKIYGYIHSKVANREITEDITQEVFTALWEKAYQYQKEASPYTWVFAIVRHKIADYYRKESHKTAPLDPDSWTTAPLFTTDTDLRIDVNRALAMIDGPAREALVLIYFVGLTYAEAAEILGLATGTLKSRVHYAKKKIRRLLQTGGEGIEC